MEQVVKRVVVVGGGFGGLQAAKTLAKDPSLQITVIDRRNHHLFQPLLYQVATAALSPAEIATPIRSVLGRYPNVRVVLDEVVDFHPGRREVHTRAGRYPFDFLVVAAGASHSYFGKNEWADLAPGLKTLEQATDVRRRILLAFEKAEMESDLESQKALLTFAIVGGGPTGVEVAGAIAEISRHTLEKDFRRIDPSRTRVILIEAGPRILASFHEALSKAATRDLEKMGVQIWTSTRVTDVSKEGVRLGSEFIQARTVVWAAGVEPSALGKQLVDRFGGELDRFGRPIVSAALELGNATGVFVIGDLANVRGPTGLPLPGLAPVALQAGRYVGTLISARSKGHTTPAFFYLDKGQMATIGRKRAIVQWGAIRFGGYLAWLMWLLIHIYYLIGFKNRIFVFFEWAWAYLTFRRGARLILEKDL